MSEKSPSKKFTQAQQADAIAARLAGEQLYGLAYGSLPDKPSDLGTLAPYCEVIDIGWATFAEGGPDGHAAVRAWLASEAKTLQREAPALWRDLQRRIAERNGHGDDTAAEQPTARPLVVTMSEVQAEPVVWLWWPYIALGKLCMLDGDPGIGKTLLMTQIATSLSLGHPLPDQQGKPTLAIGGPQATLMLSTEDGLADTLKPRLDAAKADCAKIHVLTGWLDAEDKEQTFTLQHIEVLEAAIQQYKPRLIVIDPIQAYLGPIDMHRANETRPLLAKLTRLAEQYHCAIVCIRHPSKPGQGIGKVIHRGIGSVDFIGAARTGLFVEQHPTDPNKALMAQSKSNIGPLGRTQVYSKDKGEFRWAGVSRLSAELMAGSRRGPDPHLFLEVVCWLEAHMHPGVPRAAKEIEDALAEEGYRIDTIKRAKKALSIRSDQRETGWIWTLPDLPLLLPPLPLLPLLPPLPPLPPLGQNQVLTPSGGREGSEVAVVAVGAEVAVAVVVLGEHPPPPTTAHFCGQVDYWWNASKEAWVCRLCHPPLVVQVGSNGAGRNGGG